MINIHYRLLRLRYLRCKFIGHKPNIERSRDAELIIDHLDGFYVPVSPDVAFCNYCFHEIFSISYPRATDPNILVQSKWFTYDQLQSYSFWNRAKKRIKRYIEWKTI